MNNTKIEKLYNKASELPANPGVYLMKNNLGKIIYVGKSKALKNRVTSYFKAFESHNAKTRNMISNVDDFDVIFTETEIEALALENKLIKLHSPKFNIRLKDSKSYPYIKIDVKSDYPKLSIVRNRQSDGSKYFGPFSGTGIAYSIIKSIKKTFGIPDCKKEFPKDLSTRGCIKYEIGICCGLCNGNIDKASYNEIIGNVIDYLNNGSGGVKKKLLSQMNDASDNMQYELAAKFRDRIKALDYLQERQIVVGNPDLNADFISYHSTQNISCINVIYVRNGSIIDSENVIFDNLVIIDENFFVDFIFNHYKNRESVSHKIYLGFDMSEESVSLLVTSLSSLLSSKISIIIPEIGDMKKLCILAEKNAMEYIKIQETKNIQDETTLTTLSALLKLSKTPSIIEAYDISNLGNENIIGGKISLSNGKFNKKAYRTYNIKSTDVQNDFQSMYETVLRRISHTEDELPDLILIDGGNEHVKSAKNALSELNVKIPIFGMVKDENHKTRILTDGENEISIQYNQNVFNFIYKIQEEVHRFTISKMRKKKEKTFKHSSLEQIKGIGPKKSKILLNYFNGLKHIKEASITDFEMINGITEKDAFNIYNYFHEDNIK